MARSTPLVLVAEDDAELRLSIREILEAEGYEVIAADHGAAALEAIRGSLRRPDLILIDLKMPVLSGWDFLAVRESDPVLLLTPVIVLTGERDVPRELVGDVILTKPIDAKRLRQTVARVLEESRADPERLPRSTEPWSVDARKTNLVRNSIGRVVAFVATDREARRLVAAVNGTSQISTAALEQGIVDKGLECLYELHRYDTDADYRRELDAGAGLAGILKRRAEIAGLWRSREEEKTGSLPS
jgi:CheY-like chemotaxis protein